MKLKELLLTRALFDMNINNRKIQAKRQNKQQTRTQRKDETSREDPRRKRVSKSSPVYSNVNKHTLVFPSVLHTHVHVKRTKKRQTNLGRNEVLSNVSCPFNISVASI